MKILALIFGASSLLPDVLIPLLISKSYSYNVTLDTVLLQTDMATDSVAFPASYEGYQNALIHNKKHKFVQKVANMYFYCMELSWPLLALLSSFWFSLNGLCLSGPIWACVGLSGLVWAYLSLSGLVWARLSLSDLI
jgi:hypothetical protein